MNELEINIANLQRTVEIMKDMDAPHYIVKAMENTINFLEQQSVKLIAHEFTFPEDNYSDMTREAVDDLWNDGRFTKTGLRNIALLLLEEVLE